MLEFVQNITTQNLNREEIRNTARPKNKSAENTQKQILKPENDKENVFRYNSKNKSFNLEIKFQDKSEFVKKDVLQALKEAFDSVKAQS